MASIVKRKRKDGTASMYVKFATGGRVRWERVPGGMKAARARKAEVELELAKTGGRWAPPASITFQDYAQQWLDGYATGAVKSRVVENYRRELKRAEARFGSLQLAAVSRSDVKALVAARAAEGKAANTIRNCIIPLRELFTHAVDDGLIPSNPAARIPIPTTRKRKIVPPTGDQVEQLLEAARDQDVRDALTVAASLGVRRSELFAIRWKDVDFDARLIRVHATNDRGTIVETTKSEAGERAVPLFESARKVLAARKLRTKHYDRDADLVFGTAAGTPLEPGNFQRSEFLRALKLAGLEGAFRFHDLRHFAVSTLIAQRADVKLLQAVAGHASATMTLDVYGHLMSERVTEAASLYDPLRTTAAEAASNA